MPPKPWKGASTTYPRLQHIFARHALNFAAHARVHAERGEWESALALLGDAVDWLAFGFGADPTHSDPDAAVCSYCFVPESAIRVASPPDGG